MKEACDKHGPFKRSENGILKFDDYVELRKIITRQTSRFFKPDRDIINEMRIAAFKSGDEDGYFEHFKKSHFNSYQSQIIMTQKACEYIKVGAKEYADTSKLYSQNEEMRNTLRLADAAALIGLTEKFPKISEEDAIKAYKYKIQRELEIWRIYKKYIYVIENDSLN